MAAIWLASAMSCPLAGLGASILNLGFGGGVGYAAGVSGDLLLSVTSQDRRRIGHALVAEAISASVGPILGSVMLLQAW
jgi:anti-sigma factor RsiW